MPWLVIADGSPDAAPTPTPVRTRRVVLRLVVALVAAVLVVGVLGAFAAQRLAEQEAVNDAAHTADVLAEAVVTPSLTNGLADGDAADVAAFDVMVRERILGPDVVRVKLWSPAGVVLYADEPELVGRSFELEDNQRLALEDPQTRAEVSDLTAAENQFETGGRLLEVYRPVWTPDGRELLFEMYSPYSPVAARSAELWRGFAGVTISSLLLLVVLTAPIVWRLLRRAREADAQRATLLQRAGDASDAERRRVAATLHDGPVQDLVASSFAAETAAAAATAAGKPGLADELRAVAASVRGNVRTLRSLLVDIYPASLTSAGLAQALTDLADAARARGVEVVLDVDQVDLDADDDRLVYRVAQECLRNAATHAVPCRATVRLAVLDGATVLEVEDDGPGFDPRLLEKRPEGHLGTQVIADLASGAGARLELKTVPGSGTSWRLTIPARGAR
jgi:two-component system, NarL family, sensor kinase